jgi:hypothetical protein
VKAGWDDRLGQTIVEFVSLHRAIHVFREDSPLSRSQYEDPVRDYEVLVRRVEEAGAADVRLCLALLGDVAAQLMQALGEQVAEDCVAAVLADWSGRGWTTSGDRTGILRTGNGRRET